MNRPIDRVGFSKAADGTLYLIGVGPEDWLRQRMHAGCSELVTRDVEPGDLRETPVEWFARPENA